MFDTCFHLIIFTVASDSEVRPATTFHGETWRLLISCARRRNAAAGVYLPARSFGGRPPQAAIAAIGLYLELVSDPVRSFEWESSGALAAEADRGEAEQRLRD